MNFINSLLKSTPGHSFSYYPYLISLGILLILGNIVFHYIYNARKKTDLAFKRSFKDLSKRSALMGILFLFLTVVRFENIPYFSMRLWIYISLLLLAYLVYKYKVIYFKEYKRKKEVIHHKMAHTTKQDKKYLPSKKRK